MAAQLTTTGTITLSYDTTTLATAHITVPAPQTTFTATLPAGWHNLHIRFDSACLSGEWHGISWGGTVAWRQDVARHDQAHAPQLSCSSGPSAEIGVRRLSGIRGR